MPAYRIFHKIRTLDYQGASDHDNHSLSKTACQRVWKMSKMAPMWIAAVTGILALRFGQAVCGQHWQRPL